MKKTLTLTLAGLMAVMVSNAFAHGDDEKHQDEAVTVTGEILDMACYIDHAASGQGHRKCAARCIRSGLPVGIKTAEGQVYLLIGDHKPINNRLADLAAKTVTVSGKLVERDGFKMIENAEILDVKS